jgi:hypothetical protein
MPEEKDSHPVNAGIASQGLRKGKMLKIKLPGFFI